MPYKEVGPLESCPPGGEINTRQECRRAAISLGLYAYNGSKHFRPDRPRGCYKMRAECYYGDLDLLNMVYWNNANDTAPSSVITAVAICRCWLKLDRKKIKEILLAEPWWSWSSVLFFPGPQSSILSPRSLVLGTWSSVLGPRSSIFSPQSSVLNPQSLVLLGCEADLIFDVKNCPFLP